MLTGMSASANDRSTIARRSYVRAVCAAIVLLGAAIAAPASAQNRERDYNRFELTPFGGYFGGGEFEDPTDDSERDTDNGTGYGLIFDIAAEHWRHYEILFADMDTEVEGATPFDMGVQYLHLGGIVSHPNAERVIPYFGLTIGATRFSPDQAGLDDETKFSFSAGGGLRIPITDHFGVRLDARAFVTVLDSDSDLFCKSEGGDGTCNIRAKSDTFLQYSATLGFVIGF